MTSQDTKVSRRVDGPGVRQNSSENLERLAAQRYLYSTVKTALVWQMVLVAVVPAAFALVGSFVTYKPVGGLSTVAAVYGVCMSLADLYIMLEGLERVLVEERPDMVLAYGDTNSTLAGALAAVKLHIPVAHVEAGLRSFNRRMPEEVNRVLADHAADVLFAPAEEAVDNLRREGIPDGRVFLVGDVMYDAALFYADLARRKSRVLERLGLTSKGYVLATVHRAENTDDPARLASILQGLAQMARTLPVVLPLHPRTKAVLGNGVNGRGAANGPPTKPSTRPSPHWQH